MSDIEKIQLFEDKRVRTTWDEEKQEWFFSIVDVCGILTDQPTHERARNYWKVLKSRLKKEGSEVVTKCNRLKLIAEDGKPRETDVADMAVMFRVIESIPSKKALRLLKRLARRSKRGLDIALFHLKRPSTIYNLPKNCLSRNLMNNETGRFTAACFVIS